MSVAKRGEGRVFHIVIEGGDVAQCSDPDVVGDGAKGGVIAFLEGSEAIFVPTLERINLLLHCGIHFGCDNLVMLPSSHDCNMLLLLLCGYFMQTYYN